MKTMYKKKIHYVTADKFYLEQQQRISSKFSYLCNKITRVIVDSEYRGNYMKLHVTFCSRYSANYIILVSLKEWDRT